jgi:aminopeptidase N
MNGAPLAPGAYELKPGKLIIHDPPEAFALEIVTRLDPANNTALEGLYMSSGRFCTQCEAEGFRTITYFLDRPDVMARYEVRIEAEKARFPTLLANGNPMESGDLEDGRHYAVWRDPSSPWSPASSRRCTTRSAPNPAVLSASPSMSTPARPSARISPWTA